MLLENTCSEIVKTLAYQIHLCLYLWTSRILVVMGSSSTTRRLRAAQQTLHHKIFNIKQIVMVLFENLRTGAARQKKVLSHAVVADWSILPLDFDAWRKEIKKSPRRVTIINFIQ